MINSGFLGLADSLTVQRSKKIPTAAFQQQYVSILSVNSPDILLLVFLRKLLRKPCAETLKHSCEVTEDGGGESLLPNQAAIIKRYDVG